MPVNKKTKMEIPMLNKTKKLTVPNRLTVFVKVSCWLSCSSISFFTASSRSFPLLVSGLIANR
ncbi:MAG: hypothetical protein E6528_11365, partial [Staphylococcus sp.]|nr:hypothetical protein [Staphylococcus sp.]